MKRDMDLVRQILLSIEADTNLIDPKFSTQEVAEHADILKDGGFIKAAILRGPQNQPTKCVLKSLTWDGHEFVQAMRDDTIWKKTKEKFIKPGAAWTAKAIFEYLKIEMSRHITGGSG